MKKIIVTWLLMLAFGFAEPDYRHDQFLFCLNRDAKPLQMHLTGKQLKTGNPKIDNLLQKYGIVSIERWLPEADERDVVDGIALANIYKATFAATIEMSQLKQILQDFRQISEIHSAEPQAVNRVDATFEPYIPDDPYFDRQWYIQTIGADKAWGLWYPQFPGDSTVLVGIVDTGIDYLHPELANVLYVNPGEDLDGDGRFTDADINNVDDDGNGYVDDVRGWDFADQDNDVRPPEAGPYKELSHGTHVAGVIGATVNNEVGIAGISFQSKLIISKNAKDSDTTEPGIVSGYTGILYCAKLGAKIINCSWGGGYDFYGKIVINDVVNNYGAIVACAAGNDNEDSGDDGKHYPSDFGNATSIAATNNKDVRSYYSNYGVKIDLSAPGGEGGSYSNAIYSTVHANAGSYAAWQGTSMATPVAVGSFALLKAWYPDSSREWLINTMQQTADNIDDLNPNYAGKLGSGRVNVYSAIAREYFPKIYLDDAYFSKTSDSGNTDLAPGDTVDVDLALHNKEGWATAENVQAHLSSTSPFVHLIDSVASLGTIIGGDYSDNADDALRFVLSEDAPYQNIDFILTVTANDTSKWSYQISYGLNITLSKNQQGFPVENTNISLPMAVATFANGAKKIVAIKDGKNLVLYNSDGTISNGFPIETGSVSMAPIVADMDRDGTKEIVVVSRTGTLYEYHEDGALVRKFVTGEAVYGDAAVANLDDDPDLEIAFGTMRKHVHIIKTDSSELSGFPLSQAGLIDKGVSLADLNADGVPEIIFGTFDGNLQAVYATGDTVAGFPVAITDKIVKTPVTVQTDAGISIIILTKDKKLQIFGADGIQQAVYPFSGVATSVPALCDWNNDGNPEVFFTSDDHFVHGVTLQGDSLDTFPRLMEDRVETGLVFADFNNDGSYEMVMGLLDGSVHTLRPDGSELAHFPLIFDEALHSVPVVADLDNDGDLEIVINTLDNLNVIDVDGAKNAQQIWPTYLGGNHRTGFYQDAITAINPDKPAALPATSALNQNYPNPFNPTTTISYTIGAMRTSPARVKLTIYNALGQKVRELVHSKQPAGTYRVHFTAGNLASGIYLYRLQIGSQTLTKKMVFLK